MVNKLSVRLASGETVKLLGGEAEIRLYSALWQINRRGAIAAVVKLRDARLARSKVGLVVLDEDETSALREALARAPSASEG